ncbi:hypothetical protein GTY86_33780 [Streptomyces sp. SID5770]|uniref:hypothetical protein n=1 Tax=Streptomyces sp. SID5770 TaxID=2690308 RepID=UPI001368BF00|nr:hypothetical protein [Streptomyces sp. SID5770]MZE56156.1 hypothetical protein [Streptomyces sp. SID5770]
MTQGLPYPNLFDGCDAGAYTLPDQLLKLRDTYRAIEAQPYPDPPENPWDVIARLAEETVDAVQDGKPLPDPTQIEQARTAERVHEDVLTMMSGCLDLAAKRVRAGIQAYGAAIITDHLKPAHDKLWADFKAAWHTLQEYGQTEPRHLLAAPPKVRKASDTCDQLAAQYPVIHEARSILARAGFNCPDDPTGKYAAIRNYHQLAPSRLAMARPPWSGLSTRQFLGWHATNGGQLWLPTPDEQKDAVWAEADTNPVKRAAGF